MKNRDMQIVQMEKFYLVLESKCAQNGGHWFSFLDNPPIQMKYPETDILSPGCSAPPLNIQKQKFGVVFRLTNTSSALEKSSNVSKLKYRKFDNCIICDHRNQGLVHFYANGYLKVSFLTSIKI